ncbi:glycoside hydrolase family 97 protein [Microbulbifer taiwanensis]|uniref:Glycoside hydrolase family 97 protein n=1 Tax=Microbulbifer taiwanensis TaxID=986746 RepID=A0ABW1YS32_9GAMM|nr:glycoside hydrolase family 97 protein [Microbulbifer taiwanensis]
MRWITAVALLLVADGPALGADNKFRLQSPDGRTEVDVTVQGEIRYSVSVDGEPLLRDSLADLLVGNMSVAKSARSVSARERSVERLLHPAVPEKFSQIRESYNELTLALNNNFTISFRAFDNGIAYRFNALDGSGNFAVSDELAEIRFVGSGLAYFPEEQGFVSHNERAYLPAPLKELDGQRLASLPLLVDGGAVKVVITESGLRDYPGMWLAGSSGNGLSARFPRRVLQASLKENSDRNQLIERRADYLAQTGGPREFPWRIVAIAREDAELLTNQLSYLLAGEQQLTDADWIRPGKVAWDWWNANNLYGVDFEAGVNTETYKYYIDFAAKYGLEYILLDEGWYRLGNLLQESENIDVQAIIDYGREKNVGVILWVVWETLERQMDEALDRFADWGAAGIKVDFMQRDDQDMVSYYWRVAEQAAKRRLLVNFHGSYKPAGLRRAWPNVLTREGVRGLEHNKWADYITPEHNLTIPFIRMLAGPMDYTPGAMVNAQPDNFHISFARPMSKTSRAHQLAMYVIYESPLQMLADSPSNYLREAASTEFIASVPTVWDETRIVSAKLGDHIITARRAGSDWFIGAMGNGEARRFSFELEFLGDGKYQMTSIGDGVNAARYAGDHSVRSQMVSGDSSVKIALAPGGGWVAKLEKI